MSSKLKEGLSESLGAFFDPESRLFYLYLATSIVMALGYLAFSKSRKDVIKRLRNPEVWLGQSARIDYYFFVFNGFVKVMLIGPYFISILYLAFYFSDFFDRFLGPSTLHFTRLQWMIGYTIALTLLNDFGCFIVHYLLHRIPALWEFHKIHHSATALNPITQYRIHPVELFLQNVRGLVIPAFVLGFFDYLSVQPIEMWMIFGINGVYFLFRLLGANLRHSEVPLKYPLAFEKWFISPYQHQIHHGSVPRHHHKNMGIIFAFWDRLFGTLATSDQVQDLKFGLGKEDENYVSFWQNLYYPFVSFFKKHTGKSKFEQHKDK